MKLLVPANARLGESPMWSGSEGALYWLDLLKPSLHRWSDRGGHTVIPLAVPAPLGSITPASPGTAILTSAAGVHLLELQTGETRLLLNPLARLPHLHFNDGKIDRSGRLWLGTADYDEADPRAVLYVLEGSELTVADAGFAVCNGPAFSPDGSIVYFSDSNDRRILRYRLTEGGTLVDRRVFAAFSEEEGYPDGLTVDADGFLWVAHWGGGRVSRISADGAVDLILSVPAPNVTSVAFGGEDLDLLFITTATAELDTAALGASPLSGGLFVEKLHGVHGIAEPAWRGGLGDA